MFCYSGNFLFLNGKYNHMKRSIMSLGTLGNLKILTCHEIWVSILIRLVKLVKRKKVLILWIDCVQMKNSLEILKHVVYKLYLWLYPYKLGLHGVPTYKLACISLRHFSLVCTLFFMLRIHFFQILHIFHLWKFYNYFESNVVL